MYELISALLYLAFRLFQTMQRMCGSKLEGSASVGVVCVWRGLCLPVITFHKTKHARITYLHTPHCIRGNRGRACSVCVCVRMLACVFVCIWSQTNNLQGAALDCREKQAVGKGVPRTPNGLNRPSFKALQFSLLPHTQTHKHKDAGYPTVKRTKMLKHTQTHK